MTRVDFSLIYCDRLYRSLNGKKITDKPERKNASNALHEILGEIIIGEGAKFMRTMT